VIDRTEQHMYERLNAFEDKMVFVTGCLPPVAKDKLGEYKNVIILDAALVHEKFMELPSAPKNTSAVLQIARGCSGHCTYCITRLARGKLVSFPLEDIVSQAKKIVESGGKEIQVTAQDTASWGLDRNDGLRLPDLLRELCKIDGDFKIRVGMANPDNLLPILDEFLDAFKSEKIFLFLHIPVQSGSDSVLKLMGRRYTSAQYEEIITRARLAFQDIRISTDYIAGFSNETDCDAEKSVEQILRTKPAKVNITRFSVRPNTPAAKLKRIPEDVKKVRSKSLTDAANYVSEEDGKSWIGRETDCVVTEIVKKGSVTARNRSYEDIVILENLEIGTKLRVKITGYKNHYLIGERVE
ncbi:MAG: tRNA (N(6)-L-threonylcarbamoyladenosine(37)-C(2))-methylthiotransferase, partial [Methanocorpusculum sp.]|nr:tRNA (N(6)-L-threonylcarbamoyladenosine(37)-C(2))-methylthiotransferase [Methanocorpusculum sp.]